MAKYSKGAQKKVERSMHEMKRGKLKSGRSGQTVKNRKQAIAIGLSEAREKGEKVPRKKGAKKSAAKRGARKSPAKRGAKKGRSAKKSTGTRKRTGRAAKKGGAKKSSAKRGRKRTS
jgi:hypothetical protein